MNCPQFDTVVVELACGHLMEAVTKSRALAHVDECRRCAALLAAERRMSAHLQAFAEDDAAIQAPDRVRLALEAAFDAQFARPAQPSAPVLAPKVIAITRPARPRRRWALAAAAMLLCAAGAATLALLPRTSGLERTTDPAKSGAIATAQVQAASEAKSKQTPSASESRPAEGEAAKPASVKRPIAVKRDTKPRPAAVPEATTTRDDVAEMLRLTPLVEGGPQEFEQVVRIEVPRSTLMMWGVPVNAERAAERVQAEVFIGEDGVARAIRLLN